MREEPHPINGALYKEIGDGLVRVESGDGKEHGVFRFTGEWMEGAIRHADPALLIYIGGPDLPEGHNVPWMMTPAAVHDGSIEVKSPYGGGGRPMPRTVSMYKADPGLMTEDGMRSAGHMDSAYFLDNDRHPERVPDVYRLKSPMTGGPQRVGIDRYLTREFHDLEVERLWKRTWQMACREDDIPEVGDYHVYEIANLSFLIVRTAPDEIKAHYNACLHRGRILKECSGHGARELRCPFHGWTWRLDGSLKDITTEWDFPGVREDVARLPGAKVATWGGFVFINPDLDAGPLEDFLGPVMMGHYEKFRFDGRYKQAHVQRVIRANWKIVMEAFMESYHVISTHPQQMLVSGDLANSHYDVFGNWGRAGHIGIFPGSPQRGIFTTPEEALTRYRMSADFTRNFLRGLIGDEVDDYSDAEMNDSSSFNDLFPNFHPWGGWSRINFRFRPNGSNPDECIMDVILLAPWPKDKPKPPPAKIRFLGPDEPWTAASELLSLSKIIDQDVFNLPKVQAGLKTKQPPHIWYSSYQEGKIRNFHRNYDRVMGLDANGVPA